MLDLGVPEVVRPDSATSRSSVGEHEMSSQTGDDQPSTPPTVSASDGSSNPATSQVPLIDLEGGGCVAAKQYPHSVSGHHVMLVKEGHLWKATRSHREERFYVSLFGAEPSQAVARRNSVGHLTRVASNHIDDVVLSIRHFVPRFFGIHVVASVPEGAPPPHEHQRPHKAAAPASDGADQGGSDAVGREETLAEVALRAVACNDKASLQRVMQDCEMIELEDICAGFCRPCILDIKMGSRQYGINAPTAKIRSKTAKAAQTTSARFGFRLAGMKCWNDNTATFTGLDKYECRSFDWCASAAVIRSFMREDRALMAAFATRLEELLEVMQQQPLFRFFTSSLLLVYDAQDPVSTARVCMIDFAYTYTKAELEAAGDPDAALERDEGYCLGLRSLLRIIAGGDDGDGNNHNDGGGGGGDEGR